GAADGLTLRYVGFDRSVAGRSTREALIAACTSRAAPSMSRERSNCSVTRVEPTELFDVISFTLGIVPRRRSSGVATLVAIVSGLAPGMFALTEMTGRSTCGSEATGSAKNAPMPASAMPAVSSTVPIGRITNGRDRLMIPPRSRRASGLALGRSRFAAPRGGGTRGSGRPFAARGRFGQRRPHAAAEPVEREIDDRRREERQQLAHDQAAENRESERATQFGPDAERQHQ